MTENSRKMMKYSRTTALHTIAENIRIWICFCLISRDKSIWGTMSLRHSFVSVGQ